MDTCKRLGRSSANWFDEEIQAKELGQQVVPGLVFAFSVQ